jgi:hypothetical protein
MTIPAHPRCRCRARLGVYEGDKPGNGVTVNNFRNTL